MHAFTKGLEFTVVVITMDAVMMQSSIVLPDFDVAKVSLFELPERETEKLFFF